MNNSQHYLGTPNAVVLCINSIQPQFTGLMYTSYHRKPAHIDSVIELLERMEKLFNELNFPFPGNNERHFIAVNGTPAAGLSKEKVMSDEKLLNVHGDLGTFIIRVQHRQNSSWQGRITWVEQDKTLYFRSIWEMMKLIDEAMEVYKNDEEEEDTPTWD